MQHKLALISEKIVQSDLYKKKKATQISKGKPNISADCSENSN